MRLPEQDEGAGMRIVWASVLTAGLAVQAMAAAPESSVRPMPRAVVETVAPAPVAKTTTLPEPMVAGAEAQIRPAARPSSIEAIFHRDVADELRAAGVPGFVPEDAALGIARATAFAARSPQAIALSLRPLLRPPAMVEKAMARRQERARGAVCGDLALQGLHVGHVPGRISACGVQDAVKIRSVAGVTLSQQAVMDCTTAKTLKRWVESGLKPAVGSQGGGVAGLRVAAHYACRTRNNQPGAKVSEHGKGRAIDIAAVRLKDGSEISVLRDWGRGAKGASLKRMHGSACRTFGTVLGPGSDGHHRDHLHFDTARHRSGGSYCR